MTAVREGDLAKLGLLFERYHVPLFEFLSRITGDRQVAEDLVQDIFVRILKYRATFRDGGSFETWVYRIARNARADYFRTRQATGAVAEEEPDRPDHAPGPVRQLEADRDRARLKRALMMLREDKRELIVLARFQGVKHERIAEMLGIEAGAVKVRIHRALKELRQIFVELPDGNAPWDVKRSGRTLQII
jgi:RNA polymerase sigma-70 factor (ECF subfamily)